MLVRKLITATILCAFSAIASAEKVVIIEMYGDSTTAGAQTINGVQTSTPNSEPNKLQDLLQAKFGKRVVVFNQGVGGTQAFQLLTGTDRRNRNFGAQMAASRADIVTLNYLLNDQHFSVVPTPGMYSETPEMYSNILGWLAQTARDNGKEVIFQEPNPICKEPVPGNIETFLGVLRKTAKDMNVLLVPQYDQIKSLPNWETLYSSCSHPFDQLYEMKAKRTFEVINPIVEKILADNK
ncbi:SGNH/GDSL hydrolase family protein [Pseudomonas nitroreducens]|uniref:SGNH/GDSL hydrolase family protein n=1 Tax=Pseudomonas nitroreducens TaxID=46680 RepID=UPI002D7E46BA|nr:SGNH/GDSL hydrolase family protein [Pseudomonas nitroreducens]